MAVEWEGRFEEDSDQERLVEEAPLLLVFRAGENDTEYVRRDAFDRVLAALDKLDAVITTQGSVQIAPFAHAMERVREYRQALEADAHVLFPEVAPDAD